MQLIAAGGELWATNGTKGSLGLSAEVCSRNNNGIEGLSISEQNTANLEYCNLIIRVTLTIAFLRGALKDIIYTQN